MFPTASILMRAIVDVSKGSVTASEPSLGVLDARTYGHVEPPSMESRIRTFEQLTGGFCVFATFQLTVFVVPSVQKVPVAGCVTTKGPLGPSTVIVAPLKVTPSSLS